MSKIKKMLSEISIMSLATEDMVNEQIYEFHKRPEVRNRQEPRRVPNNDGVNYAANITPYISKPVRKGVGKKKLSKKQRKLQTKR